MECPKPKRQVQEASQRNVTAREACRTSRSQEGGSEVVSKVNDKRQSIVHQAGELRRGAEVEAVEAEL